MSPTEWNPQYNTDIPAVDTQHRRLVDLIARLESAITAGQGNQAIADTLRELVDYLRTHFAEEERLLRQHQYSGLHEHIAHHQQMTRDVARFIKDIQANKGIMARDLMLFLRNWLFTHIAKADQAYAQEFRARGIVIAGDDLLSYLEKRK